MNPTGPHHFSQWDPMFDAFSSKAFNSYSKPSVDADFIAKYKDFDASKSVPLSFSPTKGDEEEVKLYLCNIPLALTKEGLRSFLSQAAPVTSVKICKSKDPERGTTFGFATVNSPRDAETIIREFHDYSFGTNSNLKVKLALTFEEKDRQKEFQREEDSFYQHLYNNSENFSKEDNLVSKTDSKEVANSVVISSTDTKGSVKSDRLAKVDMGKGSASSSDDMDVKTQASQKKGAKKCLYCNGVGYKQCGRCHGCYCSVECQRSDWNKHQKICSSKESSSNNSTPTNHKSSAPLDEDSLFISMNGIDLQEKLYYINDLRVQKEIESQVRLMIYVVENLIMKGQVISEEDTTSLIELTQRLGTYVKESPATLEKDDCSEGLLVILEYEGEMCRAVIKDYHIGDSAANVYFFDYGNSECCKVADMIPLPDFATELPMQCRSFCLHGFPDNVGNAIDKLNEKLKELTIEKLLQGENKGSEKGIYQLILQEEGTEGKTVNQLLLSYYEELRDEEMQNVSECTKQAVIMEDEIPLEPFPTQQDFRILVCDVVSPLLFYGQIVADDLSNVKELASMSESLQALSDTTAGSSFKPKVGQACMAFFPEDQTWYRASVEGINNNGTVNVYYFDYGNSADVDLCFVKPIDAKFTSLPKQARKFALSGVRSINPSGQWSEEAISLFKEFACAEPCDVLCMKIDDKCHVQLYMENIDTCMDQLLKDRGYAIPDEVVPATTEPKKGSSSENDAKVEKVNVKKQDLNQKPFTLETTKIETGNVYKVVAVHIEDPGHFYVHVARPELETLLGFCTVLHEMKLSKYKNPLQNDSCCALFTDGDWYRAKIISAGQEESVVYFYDYGNQCTVKNTALRVMPEEVKSLTAQAVKVKLHDIAPNHEKSLWSASDKEYFTTLISDRLCELKVVHVDDNVAIGNLISLEDNGDIGERLIQKGIAKRHSTAKIEKSLDRKSLEEGLENSTKSDQKEASKLRSENNVFASDVSNVPARNENGEGKNSSSIITMNQTKDNPLEEKSVVKENIAKTKTNTKLPPPKKNDKSDNLNRRSNSDEFQNSTESSDDSSSQPSVEKNENGFEVNGFKGSSRGKFVSGNRSSYGSSFGGNRPGFGRGHESYYQKYGNGQKGGPHQHQLYPPFMYPFNPLMYSSGHGCCQHGHSTATFPFGDRDQSELSSGNDDEYSEKSVEQGNRGEGSMFGNSYIPRGNNVFRGSRARGSRGFARGGSRNQSSRHHRKLPQQKPPSKFCSGANISFIVTHVESPSHFYIQDGSQRDDCHLPMAVYQNANPIESVDIGMLCAAKTVSTDVYFRAVIESIFSDKKIFVRCADTGKHEIVDKAHLRRLSPEDFMRPFKAVKCVLYNACGKGKYSWPVHVTKYFSHKIDIAGGKMEAIVHGEAPSGLMIAIKDPENHASFLVDDLVRQGFATYMHPE